MNSRRITVFEHESIRIGEGGLSKGAFRALALFSEKSQGRFFGLGYESIRFKDYVGVIQVGRLTIEILPKADRQSASAGEEKWRRILFGMLVQTRRLSPEVVGTAEIVARNRTLLDLYVEQFIGEVERLFAEGPTRRYRTVQCNVRALKGRVIFSEQLKENLVHQEQWYTEHNTYDRNNRFNGILKRALGVVVGLSTAGANRERRVRRLLELMEGIDPFDPPDNDLERTTFDRKTERYRTALSLAWMIIRGYAPDVLSGKYDVTAILIDMNKLFEEYTFRVLARVARSRASTSVRVIAHPHRNFWGRLEPFPDILLEDSAAPSPRRLVLDTKWKVLYTNRPSETDLRQVFAYNLYFDADKAILVYPFVGQHSDGAVPFRSVNLSPDHRHTCEVYFAELVDDHGELSDGFAEELLGRLA